MMDSKGCMEIEEGSHSKSPQQPTETNLTIKMPENNTSTSETLEVLPTIGVNKLYSFTYNLMIAAIIITICTISLPLLLGSFLVTRALQLIRHGEDYDTAVKLKLFIRAWIFTGLSGLAIFLAIIKDIDVRYLIIFGIYVLNWVLSVVTFKFVPSVPLDNSESGLNIPENVLEIIDCSIWLVYIHHFLKYKKNELYLIKKLMFAVITCNVIVLCSRLMVRFLKFVCGRFDPGIDKTSRRYLFMEKIMHIRYLMYYANGTKRSIDFICCSFVILVTWAWRGYLSFYQIRMYIEEKEVGTITFLCLLLFAILWLLKTCLSLSWEVCAIYNRLEPKIVEGAKQLYFLGIMGRHSHDIFNLLYRRKTDTDPETRAKEIIISLIFNIFPINLINIESKYHSKKDQEDGSKDGQGYDLYLSTKMRNKVKGDLLLKKGGRPSLYDMQQIAQYFLQAKETLKNDNYIRDILHKLKSSSQEQNSSNGSLPKRELRELIEAGMKDNNEEDWKYFERECATPSTDISPPEPKNEQRTKEDTVDIEAIEDWMERARTHCLFLANTLASAKEGVRCLNNIISWLLIAAIFTLWLLLTRFATTQVLVVITSPFLAATFIFGESCKTWFQGIIFAYVVHPFDVGDLCIIDDIMMEVRIIGVWITTFSKVEKLEEVIYPNSQLLTKKITNHKINFDWNDSIVLGVAQLKYDVIMNVKKEIEKYLNNKKEKISETFVEVLMGTESGNKITVTFIHNVEMGDKTYYQCHKKKQKLSSELIDDLQNIVDEHSTKIGDANSIDQ